jgi:hypothetical protein
LKKIPVVIQLRDKDIRRADLLKELEIDKYSLEKEMTRQPGTYGWWVALYAESVHRLDTLRDRLDRREARLFHHYRKRKKRPAEIKLLVKLDDDYKAQLEKIREWEKTVNFLKHAERAFSQRQVMLQMLAAGERREKKHS